eukprot:SM000045S16198  [mRNA]  locus=s45:251481:254282:+ [translate_table: standard]
MGSAMAQLGPVLPANQLQVLSAALLTVVLGVTNRVLYKMALVPLRDYPFFLAQLTTFGYVAVYFSILRWRHQSGVVTDEMLRVPKWRFAMMGGLEAIGLASGMAAAALLPGAIIPILTQVFLVWQLVLSATILGKRFSGGQIFGCVLVILGVIVVVSSGMGSSNYFAGTGLWPLLMIVSTAFPAAASILKEYVFKDAATRLKGEGLDLFVVNSYGSSFQALFIFMMLPLLSRLRGIPFWQLGSYFASGTACFFNYGAAGVGCEGAPGIPLLYVIANLMFNIAALNLLKTSSALVASLCVTVSVPLTIAAFTLRLPLLGSPAPLTPGFFTGTAILVLGLALYNMTAIRPKEEAKEA